MFILFLCLWILFNGRFTWEIFFFGLGISTLLYAFCCRFMNVSFKKECKSLKKLPHIFSYMWLLICEIIQSNLALTRLVFSKHPEVHPQLITFETPLESDIAKTILCDSITLTPGTITVNVEGNKITVHCLDYSFAEGIENCVFQQKLMKYRKEDKA